MMPAARRVVLLVFALLLASCGVPTDSEPRVLPAPATPTPEPTTPPVEQIEARIFLLNAENKVVPVAREISATMPVETVVAALAAGPTEDEQEAELNSAVPASLQILEASVDETGLLRLDFTISDEDNPGVNLQAAFFAQIVYTVTDLTGIQRVSFFRDGEDVNVPSQEEGDFFAGEPIDPSLYPCFDPNTDAPVCQE